MGDSDPLERKRYTTAHLLQDAAARCAGMGEAQVMCDQIWRRLDAEQVTLRDASDDANRSSSDRTSATATADLLEQFTDIVTQFRAFLATNARNDKIYRLASSRVVIAKCRSFHEAIDVLLVTANGSTSEVHEWRDRFENALENVLLAFEALSRDRMALLRDLRDVQAQQEALTLIMYEHKRRSSGHGSARERQIIQSAFNTITRFSRARAPVVPPAFVALYDLDAFDPEPLERVASVGDVVVAEHSGVCDGVRVRVLFIRPDVAQFAAFERVVSVWHGLTASPYVVRLIGVCHVGSPFIVIEDPSGSTLCDFVSQSPALVWTKLHDAALGLHALHNQSVVHGALTRSSVLVASDGTTKIADNVLRALQPDVMSSSAEALRWTAPELQQHDNERSATPTPATDVFAFGTCVLDALAAASGSSGTADGSTKPQRATDEQWAFVQRMRATDLTERPAMSDVVETFAAFAAHEALGPVAETPAPDNEDIVITDDIVTQDTSVESASSAAGAFATAPAPAVSAGDRAAGNQAAKPATAAEAKRLAKETRKREKEARKQAKRARKTTQADTDKPKCIVM